MSRTEVELAPTFTVKPRIREEDDGNRLLIECELNAIPRPEVKWSKDGVKPDEDGFRVQTYVQETRPHHYLVVCEINDVNEPDSGLYRVDAHNLMGVIDSSIRMNFDCKFFVFVVSLCCLLIF